MQQRIIFAPRDAAAAGRENDARPLAKLPQRLGLEAAERRLAALGEDLRDRLPGLLLDIGVTLDHLAAQPLAEPPRHAALAAARHPDQNDVFQPGPYSPFDLRDAPVRDLRSGEQLRAPLRLRHQHREAACARNTELLGL